MRIIDRYLLSTFIKVFLICLVSMAGLYIVIDFFGNLEEFISYGQHGGGMFRVLVDSLISTGAWS